MIVCKVWDSEYPWDVRVEKIARTLTDLGHDVHLVARNRQRAPGGESRPEAHVHRMPPWRSLPKRLDGAMMFPAFMNPRWLRLIDRTVRASRADVLLCRDLPLAPTALWVARRRRIPVVLDMAENYPAMIRANWESGRQAWVDILVRNPRLASWVEGWVVRAVDHVLTVVEESRERVLALGVPAGRISIVSNTPPLSRLEPSLPERPRALAGSRIALSYLGLLEIPRGIGVLLDAMAVCRRRGLQVRLDVYGTGRDRGIFEAQAATLGLGPAVAFHGYVPNEVALEAVRRADVGVVPHFADESWNTTIPNKLFDYMAAGLPVISSNARPAARIVSATGCGEVFRDRDADDLARAIESMLSEKRRQECGSAGRRAIQQQYHWEADARRLESALLGVVSRTRLMPAAR